MNEGGAYATLARFSAELQQRRDGYQLAVALVEFIAESTAACQDLAAVLDLPPEKVEQIHRLARQRARQALAAPVGADDLRPRLGLHLESVA